MLGWIPDDEALHDLAAYADVGSENVAVLWRTPQHSRAHVAAISVLKKLQGCGERVNHSNRRERRHLPESDSANIPDPPLTEFVYSRSMAVKRNANT
jgi:hypothetical protein